MVKALDKLEQAVLCPLLQLAYFTSRLLGSRCTHLSDQNAFENVQRLYLQAVAKMQKGLRKVAKG